MSPVSKAKHQTAKLLKIQAKKDKSRKSRNSNASASWIWSYCRRGGRRTGQSIDGSRFRTSGAPLFEILEARHRKAYMFRSSVVGCLILLFISSRSLPQLHSRLSPRIFLTILTGVTPKFATIIISIAETAGHDASSSPEKMVT